MAYPDLDKYRKGIVAIRPVIFFQAIADGPISTLGILSEDGFTRPTEKSTQAVFSAYHGDAFPIAHIIKEGEKLIEVSFVNYNKHAIATCFPNMVEVDAVNPTSDTEPLQGNLKLKSNAGVNQAGILIVKTAYIDSQGNAVSLTDKADPNNLDLMYPIASAIGIQGLEYKGGENTAPTFIFSVYPNSDDIYEIEGSGIDETDMTYTAPVA